MHVLRSLAALRRTAIEVVDAVDTLLVALQREVGRRLADAPHLHARTRPPSACEQCSTAIPCLSVQRQEIGSALYQPDTPFSHLVLYTAVSEDA